MSKDPNILIPLIRKLMPGIVAQDIAGVQPMSGGIGQVFDLKPKMLPKFQKVNHLEGIPEGHVAVTVSWEVGMWIESTFSISEWKFLDGLHTSAYIISEQAYTWLALKWG